MLRDAAPGQFVRVIRRDADGIDLSGMTGRVRGRQQDGAIVVLLSAWGIERAFWPEQLRREVTASETAVIAQEAIPHGPIPMMAARRTREDAAPRLSAAAPRKASA